MKGLKSLYTLLAIVSLVGTLIIGIGLPIIKHYWELSDYMVYLLIVFSGIFCFFVYTKEAIKTK